MVSEEENYKCVSRYCWEGCGMKNLPLSACWRNYGRTQGAELRHMWDEAYATWLMLKFWERLGTGVGFYQSGLSVHYFTGKALNMAISAYSVIWFVKPDTRKTQAQCNSDLELGGESCHPLQDYAPEIVTSTFNAYWLGVQNWAVCMLSKSPYCPSHTHTHTHTHLYL